MTERNEKQQRNDSASGWSRVIRRNCFHTREREEEYAGHKQLFVGFKMCYVMFRWVMFNTWEWNWVEDSLMKHVKVITARNTRVRSGHGITNRRRWKENLQIVFIWTSWQRPRKAKPENEAAIEFQAIRWRKIERNESKINLLTFIMEFQLSWKWRREVSKSIHR